MMLPASFQDMRHRAAAQTVGMFLKQLSFETKNTENTKICRVGF